MTVRSPVKLGAGGIPTEMTAAEKEEIIKRGVYLYGAPSGSGTYANLPPVYLEFGLVNGNLNQMHDNRDTAGAAVTDASGPLTSISASSNANDAAGTSINDHISMAIGNSTTAASGHDIGEDVTDVSNLGFPLYLDGGNLVAMTKDDFLDTFVFPTIERLVDGNDHDGTIKIDQGNLVGEVAGHSPVSVGNAVFSDSRFDAQLLHGLSASGTTVTDDGSNLSSWFSRLTGAGVDQPTTVTSNTRYYMHIANSGNSYGTPTHALPLKYLHNTTSINEFSQTEFDDIFRKLIKFTAINTSPYRIKYQIRLSATAHPTPGQHKESGSLVSFPSDPSYAGGWNAKGETMTDTTLNGQVELKKQFGADDYAAQIMPTGSPEVEGAYQLMIYRD